MHVRWWAEFPTGRIWPPSPWPQPFEGPFIVNWTRRDTSDVLQIRARRRIRKEDVKVRFLEPDTIEVEVPRRAAGEEIPIE